MAVKKTKEKQKDIKSLTRKVILSGDINVSIDNHEIKMSKNGKEITRKFNLIVDVKNEGNELILTTRNSSKRESKIIGSEASHIKNMIDGLNDGFKYKLQVANVHFPITIEHDKANNRLVIKNFLGEKTPRLANILPNVNIKIIKDVIELESENIENAGQTAANIEKATKVRLRDRRVFQDGIYITEKPGRNFLN